MKNMKTWHKVGFGLAVVLAIFSWAVGLYYWNKLPSVIPTHFGISGQADGWSTKSLFSVFFMPLLQTIMLVGFIFLYYKPQYSDMPTTLWLMTLAKEKREHAFDLIRTMLVGISLWIGGLFGYMAYAMNASALNTDLGLSPWIMFGILGAMLIWLAWWTIKVYRATRDAIKKEA